MSRPDCSHRRRCAGAPSPTPTPTASARVRTGDDAPCRHEGVSSRELVVLGTASQSPTRERNHNGYLLRWDGEGILFDPGEGTQRQFQFADASAAATTRICISHFHGDHCLGLPGMILRLALDEGHLPVPVHYPAGGEQYFRRLCLATAGQENTEVIACPVHETGVIHTDDRMSIRSAPLNHLVDTVGYRVDEPDRLHFLPDRLEALGIDGPSVGRLADAGSIDVNGRTVALEEVTEWRRGQSFAYTLDTRWCEGAVDLAAGVDVLLCEATFQSADQHLAERHGHLTARQAGRLAAEAGVRLLVLTHFSPRYSDEEAFADEAALEYGGEIVLASDLDRIAIPPRD
jgi:ribonuclease Z